jgi:cysteine-rich repeat protein
VARDSCLQSCVWASCGDEVVYAVLSDEDNPNPVEACDDGNNDATDACTNACRLPVCGDSIVGPGEECDEGPENGILGGTCTALCEQSYCGNGVAEFGEDCDDGNDESTDSCIQCRWAECGDGFSYLTVTDPDNANLLEECDDGDEDDHDTCLRTCVRAMCGDGFVGPGEACDDGNDIDGDGCNSCAGPGSCSNGQRDPTEQCDDGNRSNDDACLTSCAWNRCGDAFWYKLDGFDPDNPNSPEECDDGNGSNGDDCLNSCVLNVCGDGFRNLASEACDLGAANGVPGSGCSATCGGPEPCGNGQLDPGEYCDDGNDVNGDGCDNDCTPG